MSVGVPGFHLTQLAAHTSPLRYGITSMLVGPCSTAVMSDMHRQHQLVEQQASIGVRGCALRRTLLAVAHTLTS